MDLQGRLKSVTSCQRQQQQDKTRLIRAKFTFFLIYNAPIVKFSYHFPLMKAEFLAENVEICTFYILYFEHKFLTRVTFYKYLLLTTTTTTTSLLCENDILCWC